MSAEFSYELGVAVCRWPAPVDISIDFRLLREERRSGELTGEVSVRSTARTSAGLLHGAVRLNLTSTRARTELVNALSKRLTSKDFDWARLLEEACVRTIRAHREGQPAILLRDAPDPAPERHLVNRFGSEADPWMLWGNGEEVKSYWALAFGLTLHTGVPIIGTRPRATRRVGYLDWEWSGSEHKARMRRLWAGCGKDPEQLPDLVYVPCQVPLENDVERLQAKIREHALEYLIVDSVALASAGPPEEAQVALGFFQALRRLNRGALLVAHIKKGGDVDNPFGSIFWRNSIRQGWYIKRHTDTGNDLTVGMFCKKSNAGPRPSPAGFRFTFEADRTVVRPTEVRDVPELAGQVPLKDRMAHALKAGALTYAELANVLEADPESISRVARRYDGKLFTLVTGANNRVSVGLAAHPDTATPDTVRPDTPDTVRPNTDGGRTDTAPLYKGLSGSPLSGQEIAGAAK